jgi:hypothetical protein
LALLLMQGTTLFIGVSLFEDSVDRPFTSHSSSQRHSLKKQDPAKRAKNLHDNEHRSSGTVVPAGIA